VGPTKKRIARWPSVVRAHVVGRPAASPEIEAPFNWQKKKCQKSLRSTCHIESLDVCMEH
jgi:hypothetical protein